MEFAGIQPFLEALDEPTMFLANWNILLANQPARDLLGSSIEGRDVRLAIRHPQALEHILPGVAGDVDITGIGEFGRPWTVSVRRIDVGTLLVRLIDRSAAISAEIMRVDFVANASHELRTPLATIIGYSETIGDDAELNPQLCTQFGTTIHREAKRMLRIIEDLMSLSRIEAGRFVAPSERVAIADLATTAIENAHQLMEACQCSIELHLDNDLPPLLGDKGQLLQLLDNLLTNAICYGCHMRGCKIRLSVTSYENWVHISVRDNGPGIPSDHLPRVTERFYRVNTARSRESGGTGLGLAIVKHIVERHRGALDVRSTVGEGTDVIIRLPTAQ